MSHRSRRLLHPALIPGSLWDSECELLSLPPSLAAAYVTLIDRHMLRSLSESRDSSNPPVGGPSQEHTDQHFAQAFDGSVARAQLAILDPGQNETEASNALVTSLAGGLLSLTDAPCGSGAASFGLLSTVAELRAQGVLPRLPLDVILIGAELSLPARIYATEMLAELRPSLEAQAIFVTEQFLDWDVTDPLSNTSLIQRITITSATSPHRLLVIANFNAFLERGGKRAVAEPQIEELFRHASGQNSVAIWIEPNMNRVTAPGGLFQWLKVRVSMAWQRFAKHDSEAKAGEPAASSYHFRLPLQPTSSARVTLAVMRIDLVRSDV